MGDGDKIIASTPHIDTVHGNRDNYRSLRGLCDDQLIGRPRRLRPGGGMASATYAAKMMKIWTSSRGLQGHGRRNGPGGGLRRHVLAAHLQRRRHQARAFRHSTEPTDGGASTVATAGRMEIRADVHGTPLRPPPERGDIAISKMADIIADVRPQQWSRLRFIHRTSRASEGMPIPSTTPSITEDAPLPLGRGTCTVSRDFLTLLPCPAARRGRLCAISIDRRMTAGETQRPAPRRSWRTCRPSRSTAMTPASPRLRTTVRPTGEVYETEAAHFPT